MNAIVARGNAAVKVRMLLALLSIVALNVAFVTVVAWLYLVVLPTVVAGAFLVVVDGTAPSPTELARLPTSVPWLLGLTAVFLLGQVYYGYTRVLGDVRTGTVSPAEYPSVHGIVDRLAAVADVPKPAVSVVASETPNSFTVGRGHATTIVVTDSLLDLLDAAELEAVLAHEIAHVRHRDVTLMTVTGLFVAIAERTLRTARLLRRGVTDRDRISRRQQIAFDWLFPVVVFTYLFVAPVLWLFPPVAHFASGELSRQREFAADRAAANLTGAPTTLARALITAHEATPDVAATDLRGSRRALQALCVLPNGVVGSERLDPGSSLEASATGSRGVAGEMSELVAESPEPVTESSEPVTDSSEPGTGSSDSSSESPDPSLDTADSSPDQSDPPLDPMAWLGTTAASESSTDRTHPPIEQRVERLVRLED